MTEHVKRLKEVANGTTYIPATEEPMMIADLRLLLSDYERMRKALEIIAANGEREQGFNADLMDSFDQGVRAGLIDAGWIASQALKDPS